MNPLKGTLNRAGYLVWTLVPWAFLIANGVVIDLTRKDHQGTYWLGYRILVIAIFIIIYLLATVRRLQNAKLSPLLAIFAVVPVVGFAFWIAFLFIPPKTRHS